MLQDQKEKNLLDVTIFHINDNSNLDEKISSKKVNIRKQYLDFK